MSSVELVITHSGSVRMIYTERIDTHCLGLPSIRRGSHVEPTAEGYWTADLSPLNGPLLGPFLTRSEAITAEIEWLRRHWLLANSSRQSQVSETFSDTPIVSNQQEPNP